jgi:UPF0755 protein
VSRHGRRGTHGDQDDQDDQWGPGQWGPAEHPPDADEPFAPGEYGRPPGEYSQAPGQYGQARGEWGPNPIATADTGDFPVAGSSLPPASYPPDPRGGRGEDSDWGPDPLGLDTRGPDARGREAWGRAAQGPDPRGHDARSFDAPGFDAPGFDAPGFDARGLDARGGGWADQPGPEPMAPDRWAPQSWEAPSWESQSGPSPSGERASWDSETARPAGWLDPPGAAPEWAEHRDPLGDARGAAPGGLYDLQAGDLPPLPPGPLPGSGHPSGPLPPLPDSDYLWGEPPSGPLPAAAPRTRPPGHDQERSRRSRYATPPGETGPVHGGYPEDLAGYPGNGAGYLSGGAGYPEDEAGYPDNPAAYLPDRQEPAEQPDPRGRGRRRRGAPPDSRRGHPGYEGYVDDPRDLDMAPDQGQEPRDFASSGNWYEGEGEPHAWAEDDAEGGLLPGLDQGRGSRGADGGGPAAPARKRRRRGRTVLLVLLTVFVVFVGVIGGVGYHYYREYFKPPDFPGAGTGHVTVQIRPGQSASAVGATLAGKGVVASARAFSNAAKASSHGNALEPGYYQVRRHMKASLALALLLKPSSRLQTKITIPEGFRVAQIIALLGRETGNLKGYEQAIAHPGDLGLPAFANGKPEGYLFPATYEVQPKASPVTVLKMMVNQFEANAESIGLPAAAGKAQESQAGIITVASLIEAEGKLPHDYPKIAEVIYNRLNMTPPMRLQLDTTVLYAMSLAHRGGFSVNFASPYNTYLHANLPPGPIDNPGNVAIQAALHPAHGNLLYFLTINSSSGKTLFFPTAAAFNNAVTKYGSSGNSGTGSHTGSG